jgi:hypothetical protein
MDFPPDSPIARRLFAASTAPTRAAEYSGLRPSPPCSPTSSPHAPEVAELKAEVASLSAALHAVLARLPGLVEAAIASADPAIAPDADGCNPAPTHVDPAHVDPTAHVDHALAPDADGCDPATALAPDADGCQPAPIDGQKATGGPAQFALPCVSVTGGLQQQLQSASKCLMSQVRLKLHDPMLYSDQGKRFTPNCKALHAWAKQLQPEIFSRFEDGTACPGAEALIAMAEFKAELQAWLDPAACTMAV